MASETLRAFFLSIGAGELLADHFQALVEWPRPPASVWMAPAPILDFSSACESVSRFFNEIIPPSSHGIESFVLSTTLVANVGQVLGQEDAKRLEEIVTLSDGDPGPAALNEMKTAWGPWIAALRHNGDVFARSFGPITCGIEDAQKLFEGVEAAAVEGGRQRPVDRSFWISTLLIPQPDLRVN